MQDRIMRGGVKQWWWTQCEAQRPMEMEEVPAAVPTAHVRLDEGDLDLTFSLGALSTAAVLEGWLRWSILHCIHDRLAWSRS